MGESWLGSGTDELSATIREEMGTASSRPSATMTETEDPEDLPSCSSNFDAAKGHAKGCASASGERTYYALAYVRFGLRRTHKAHPRTEASLKCPVPAWHGHVRRRPCAAPSCVAPFRPALPRPAPPTFATTHSPYYPIARTRRCRVVTAAGAACASV